MRKTLLTLALLLAVVSLHAGSVTQQQARDKAAQFLASRRQGTANKTMHQPMRQPQLQQEAAASVAGAYYVFNIGDGGGFVVASGDDRTPAILGYADSGHFDAGNVPDNLRAWLDGYRQQIMRLGGQQKPAATGGSTTRKAPSVKQSIAPLLTSKWDQNDPYNRLIYPSGYKAPLTGCVATAMAQLLYYHGKRTGRPESITEDIPVYNSYVKGTEKGTLIDWESMQDTYAEGAAIVTEEQQKQADAVAQLMLMCGTSVHMSYNYDMSSASTADIPDALKNHFGYDAATRTVHRKDYTIAEWELLIRDELLEGRPVLYSGASSTSAHAFVVDGFDGDEMFHINWGWGGHSDGYFLLSIARPDDKSGAGAGSADDGYAIDQDAILGAQPDAGTVPEGLQVTFGNLDVSNNRISFAAYNWNNKATTFDVGIGFIDDNGEITEISSMKLSFKAPRQVDEYGTMQASGYTLPFTLNDIGKDTCKVVVISREDGNEKWLTPMNPHDYYIEAVRTTAGIVCTLIQPAQRIPELALQGLSLNRTSGKGKQGIVAEIKNTGGEFYGELTLETRLLSSGNSMAQKTGATIVSDAASTVSFAFSPEEVGDYEAAIYYNDANDKLIALGKDTIHVETKVRADLDLDVDLYIENADVARNSIMGNKAHLVTIVRNNTDDDYEGFIETQLLPDNITNINFVPIKQFVAAHDSAVFERDYDISIGRYYKPWCAVQNQEDNVQNNYKTVEGGWQRAVPAVTVYKANGRYQAMSATKNVEIPADAVAVDLMGNSITTTVTPSANANCLYYISDDAAMPEGLGINVVRGTHADSIRILDDALPFMPIADFTADTISYTRRFDRGIRAVVAEGDTIVYQEWTTICLPFKADRCMAADGTEMAWMQSDSLRHDFWLMEYIGDENNTLFFAPAPELRAYTPYMIAVPGAGIEGLADLTAAPVTFHGGKATLRSSDMCVTSSTNYKFVGTTMGLTDSNKTYSISDDGSICQREASLTVKPFRAYVKAMTNARTSVKAPISIMAAIDVTPSDKTETIAGDVNGDGIADVADISSVITTMAGKTTDTELARRADVNGDGTVDVADISAVITIMAGK